MFGSACQPSHLSDDRGQGLFRWGRCKWPFCCWKAGAAGDLIIGSQILTDHRLSLGRVNRLGVPTEMRGARPVEGDTAIGKRTTPIEGAAVPGPSLVALARNVTSDLFSPFGIPQAYHFTGQNQLVLPPFRERINQVKDWAEEAGVPVADSTEP